MICYGVYNHEIQGCEIPRGLFLNISLLDQKFVQSGRKIHLLFLKQSIKPHIFSKPFWSRCFIIKGGGHLSELIFYQNAMVGALGCRDEGALVSCDKMSMLCTIYCAYIYTYYAFSYVFYINILIAFPILLADTDTVYQIILSDRVPGLARLIQ